MLALENADEILEILDRFTKQKSKDIPPELEDYISYVAKTGDTVYRWPTVQYLFREKLRNVTKEFHDTTASIEGTNKSIPFFCWLCWWNETRHNFVWFRECACFTQILHYISTNFYFQTFNHAPMLTNSITNRWKLCCSSASIISTPLRSPSSVCVSCWLTRRSTTAASISSCAPWRRTF